jgi:hypothetical protein
VRRTPQDEKRLSYAKDCRNTYGQNDKASRRAIPRAKALGHRANRRVARAALSGPDAEAALGLLRSRSTWRKAPDTPLGQVIRRTLEARESRASRRARHRDHDPHPA